MCFCLWFLSSSVYQVCDAGGEVIGVIPERLMPKNVSGETVGEVRVVKDMHERKAMMADLADGFVSLPGGFGTLEETFEMITWQQLGYHDKPVGLLNIDGYYTGLANFVDHAVSQGFIRETHRRIMVVEADPIGLLDKLQMYQAPEDIVTQMKKEDDERLYRMRS
mmetsp:Transcript_5832/g.14973  ORF Transcript_5832/g.14973 Transcript_5832/m.14973 type:complete len:165 (+) Transcript_5832:216-710(+)